MEMPWRLFAGILVLWLFVGFIPYWMWGELDKAGAFADTFGFVNALFAALAFGGVIWAIRLQTRELELQRLEIEETRDELRRSADAQHLSQQMHFLSALLSARNNVAQGYAEAAGRETGPLRASHIAHRQHLAELEWLLDLVDRHQSNPFALPPPATLIAHQAELLLRRVYPVLQSALANRACNHARSILLDMNQYLRDLNRMLIEESESSEFSRELGLMIQQAETVTAACTLEEISETCEQVFNRISTRVESVLGKTLPRLVIEKPIPNDLKWPTA